MWLNTGGGHPSFLLLLLLWMIHIRAKEEPSFPWLRCVLLQEAGGKKYRLLQRGRERGARDPGHTSGAAGKVPWVLSPSTFLPSKFVELSVRTCYSSGTSDLQDAGILLKSRDGPVEFGTIGRYHFKLLRNLHYAPAHATPLGAKNYLCDLRLLLLANKKSKSGKTSPTFPWVSCIYSVYLPKVIFSDH